MATPQFSKDTDHSLQEPTTDISSPEVSGPPPPPLHALSITDGGNTLDSYSAMQPYGPPLSLQSDVIGQGTALEEADLAFTIGGDTVPSEEEVNFTSLPSVSGLVGLDHEQSKDLKSELAEKNLAIDNLQKELELTTMEKNKMAQELEESTVRHEAAIASKDAEIKQLRSEVDDYKLRLSNLEKTNRDEKARYDAKISSLEEKLRNKEEECRREKAELKQEIAENKLVIANMQTKEEKLHRELAEAKESAARAREDAAVARLTLAEESRRKMEDENLKLKEGYAVMRRSFDMVMSAEDDDLREGLLGFTEQLHSLESTASSSSMSDVHSQQLHSM